jgi:hypothetical protein
MNEDESHLNALAISHYVVGGLAALFACFPLIHLGVGLAFILGVEGMVDEQGQPPPDWFGWIFFLMGLAAFLIGQAVAVSIILSGRFLKQRRRYMFSFVVACVACLFMPVGTILGIFTIIVLSRQSVKELYQAELGLS